MPLTHVPQIGSPYWLFGPIAAALFTSAFGSGSTDCPIAIAGAKSEVATATPRASTKCFMQTLVPSPAHCYRRATRRLLKCSSVKHAAIPIAVSNDRATDGYASGALAIERRLVVDDHVAFALLKGHQVAAYVHDRAGEARFFTWAERLILGEGWG